MNWILRFNFESNFSYASCVSLGRLVWLAIFHFPHWKIKVQTADFILFIYFFWCVWLLSKTTTTEFYRNFHRILEPTT